MDRLSLHVNELGALNSGSLRTVNEALVLNLIRENEPISRVAIARITKLKESTISSIVRDLIEQSFIVETELGDSAGGRRPLMIALNRDRSRTIGVDLGCRWTTIGVTDFSGEVLYQRRIKTNQNPSRFLPKLADEIARVISDEIPAGMLIEGIGFGLPGLMDPVEGRIIYAANLDWRDVALGEHMKKRLSAPLFFEDNVRCAGLAEVWFGSLNDLKHGSAAIVVVNEGIGCALIIGGRIYRGATLGAGQAGHISIDRNGPLCRCGNRGCWEVYACDAATLTRYNEAAGTSIDKISDLIRLSREGDHRASQALQQAGRYLGEGIAILANLINPELIIFEGAITEAWLEIEPEIQSVLDQRTLRENRKSLVLHPSPIKKNTTLLGAVSLALCRNFAVARVGHKSTPTVFEPLAI